MTDECQALLKVGTKIVYVAMPVNKIFYLAAVTHRSRFAENFNAHLPVNIFIDRHIPHIYITLCIHHHKCVYPWFANLTFKI